MNLFEKMVVASNIVETMGGQEAGVYLRIRNASELGVKEWRAETIIVSSIWYPDPEKAVDGLLDGLEKAVEKRLAIAREVVHTHQEAIRTLSEGFEKAKLG